MSTDNQNKCVNMNVMSVRNTYSPKLRLLAQLGLLPWMILTKPKVIMGVIRECCSHCLNSCLTETSDLCLPLILLWLSSGYVISPFYLKVKEGRSRKGNMENTLPVKYQAVQEGSMISLKELVACQSDTIKVGCMERRVFWDGWILQENLLSVQHKLHQRNPPH